MRILRFQSYWYPEIVASSHLLEDLFCEFDKHGIITDLYVPSPTRGVDKKTRELYKSKMYEEAFEGSLRINRFPMIRETKNPVSRAIRYFLINLKQLHIGKRLKNVDLIFSGSTPPTQGLVCARIKKNLSKKYNRNIPFVYNLQDVFPDSLVTTGLTKKGSLLWKIGRKIEDYTYNSADKIIVISQSMKKNIMDKGVPEEKIEVISNWIDTEKVQPVSKENNRLYNEFGISKDKFIVVYAGNFGAAQGADVVLKAAKLLENEQDIQFVIFGGGAGFEDAKEAAKDLNNVIINPLLPAERVAEVYSLGDVALITCKKGVGNSGMPSKTWSIMACDTPIIASFDTDSELAEILKESNAGVVVEPENENELAKAVVSAKNGVIDSNSREYVCKFASRAVCPAKYVEILENLCNSDGAI